MVSKEKNEYSIFIKRMRKLVDDDIANGRGRVAATRDMFDVVRAESDYLPEKIFPGFSSMIVKSDYATVGKLARLIDVPIKMAYDSMAALLLMGQVSDKYNRKVWILMRRAAKYVPDYVDKNTEQRFYPYTALALEAHMKSKSPRAWNTIECDFGFRDQTWFESQSVAYELIVREFGLAALPPCFV